MDTATLNVRMSADLKTRGDAVLVREGISVSDAIRGLYEYLGREQSVPEFLESQDKRNEERKCERRAALGRIRDSVPVVPPDITLDAIKARRLAGQ